MKVPICDVCNKPVEIIVSHVGDISGAMGFTVYCHGQRQDVLLDKQTLVEMRGDLEFMRAFTRATQIEGEIR